MSGISVSTSYTYILMKFVTEIPLGPNAGSPICVMDGSLMSTPPYNSSENAWVTNPPCANWRGFVSRMPGKSFNNMENGTFVNRSIRILCKYNPYTP
jgi:hypothetical protein